MEDMASLWSYQECLDELKQRLLYTTLEVESVRVEANEEMRKNKEYIKQLLQLLKTACQERDETKNQLHKLLNKLMVPSTITSPPTEFFKANSSITESNSLSDTHNYSSSPVNSFFDDINVADSSNLAFVNLPQPIIDHGSLVIDEIVKGKVLPQKGKLLQSVLEAGPLLQTLLVSGPLPRWRNPPPLQTFHIPPVSIRGREAEIVNHKPAANPRCGTNLMNSSSFVEMSCGSSQMLSTTSMLNFANANNSYVPSGKRQRFQ